MAMCEMCGESVENKNSAGHYRDKCMDCVEKVATEETSHRETCDDPDCLVCTTP